ncbi:unnamed protein product [Darwinula stevensoni]|uniref:E2 ubiquitin-conjugating enzyme n=1 Tax=Darwinula stevensoni TaxID=69355 RepID=A0A7R9A4L8_9CRUS|nr:unnamed protein product [Darwinula stevensoni]CAG0893830.1 unnamed protein product [Darwinula stevensoni]
MDETYIFPDKTNLHPEKTNLNPEKTNLNPEKTNLNPEKTNLNPEKNPVQALKELCEKNSWKSPEYIDMEESGEPHNKRFLATIFEEKKVHERKMKHGKFLVLPDLTNLKEKAKARKSTSHSRMTSTWSLVLRGLEKGILIRKVIEQCIVAGKRLWEGKEGVGGEAGWKRIFDITLEIGRSSGTGPRKKPASAMKRRGRTSVRRGAPPATPSSIQQRQRLAPGSMLLPEGHIPPFPINFLSDELLGKVFSHLDDVSLACASLVCRRWSNILSDAAWMCEWHRNTHDRWPLFRPSPQRSPCGTMPTCQKQDFPWRRVYTNLFHSAPCIYCLYQNVQQHSWDESWLGTSEVPENSETPPHQKRLQKEFRNLSEDPSEGIQAQPLDSSLQHWQASIVGPYGSPYEGGRFYLSLWFPINYPFKQPLVRFLTKVFHPNVSRHGDIGIDFLRGEWKPSWSICKMLVSIQSVLTFPLCNVCMEQAIGDLCSSDPETFSRIAAAWTRRYAMHDSFLR